MSTWIEELARRIDADQPAVLVTVAATRGSTPRAPGAHMVVGQTDSAGSIGGGQLELRATELARRMMAAGATQPDVERFTLGASVGQCCGGVVQLAFEPIDHRAREWVDAARTHTDARRPWGRIVGLGVDVGVGFMAAESHAADSPPTDSHPATPTPEQPPTQPPTCVFDFARLEAACSPAGSITAFHDRSVAERAASLLAGHAHGAALAGARPDGGANWLIDVSVPPELEAVLFGAGHVGRALAQVLANLPLRLTWVETRDDGFPLSTPPGVELCCTDTPLAEVAGAAPGAVFLVLTHSHALDLDLVRAILDRADFRYCGMIGSNAKRESFERRLRARGYAESAIGRLNCPIGAPGITGKEPEVIAIAVAAELLQLRGASFAARPAQRALAAKESGLND
ncbi:MAG TPA: xanthine dehydrogenase accessory protein XdhC [Thauera sp.]|nr:xanthine dehydrogenase accessory protein XdhC [Thauera sp.]